MLGAPSPERCAIQNYNALRATRTHSGHQLSTTPIVTALTMVPAPQSLLMRGELRLAPQMHAPRPGPLPTFPCARPDQVTLELGETTQDGQHEPAMRCRRIRPSILQGPEAGLFLGNGREGVEEITGGARQPVEAGDEHDITGAEGAHEAG